MVGTAHRQSYRWVRGLGRAVLLVVGAVQCVLGVMFGVALVFSIFVYAGDGPGLAATSVLLLALDLVLLAIGLLALISGLEDWEPPYDRWHGLRWSTLGLASGAISVASWAVAALVIWAG
jgi:hypothetical protein